jgi:hypothetical protein
MKKKSNGKLNLEKNMNEINEDEKNSDTKVNL